MIPWSLLDTAKIPGSSDELRLKRRGSEFSIMLGSNELMNSRLSGSEEALARLSWERIAARPSPALLIGGLGMGFTLRAALAELPADATVVVAELVPSVIAWARGPMSEVFAGSLDDPRVTVQEGDVGGIIRDATNAYDAILLDVDNGPEALTRSENNKIYDLAGLRAGWKALRPGGVLSVWSSAPDAQFTRRLQSCGFATDEVKVRASRKGSGARHTIWIGQKKA